MTKISQKEYVESLVDIVKKEVEDLVFHNMIDEFNYIENSYHSKDVTRMIYSLIKESMIKVENKVKFFITEKGVPRKQRVKKSGKDDKESKDDKEVKNVEEGKEVKVKTNDEKEKEKNEKEKEKNEKEKEKEKKVKKSKTKEGK